MTGTVGIALVGSKFMGAAHSNAWQQVTRFFDPPLTPVLHSVVARDAEAVTGFGRRWGWQHASTDLAAVLADPHVGLVDVCTPNDVHREQAVAALEAGKHVACEKPLAGTLADARVMAKAAQAAPGRTFVWFSYRRVPAIALARTLVSQGRIGEIRHVRAVYAQQWGGPAAPAVWRFDASVAGSGAHGDLNAHIVDAVRFVTGEELVEVSGAVTKTFVPSHTVDDAVLFLARLSGGGIATFEATRLATGYHNHHGFEIHGELGALRFWFDEMPYLDYYDATAEPLVRGWTRIEVSDGDAGHPWVGSWWPAGHPIGYEHTFTNQAADILTVLGGGEPVAPLPDFAEALVVQAVLATALESARRGAPVEVGELLLAD
ncbi:MAG: Gfo/Idh/MocA family protein [Kineosporiaceae bacterium]|jgi:predicted dehydrogenase